MKKNIKDYLHLYLGCEMKSTGGRKGKLVDVGETICVVVYDNDDPRGRVIYHDWIKPILRPISDMNSDEAEHFAWLCLNSPHAPKDFEKIDKDEIQIELVHNDGGLMLDDDVDIYINVSCRCMDGYIAIMKDGRIGIANESDIPTREMQPVDDVYGKVHWLLKKGFDLFGLIESGLAIDKTELHNQKQ